MRSVTNFLTEFQYCSQDCWHINCLGFFLFKKRFIHVVLLHTGNMIMVYFFIKNLKTFIER